MTIGPAPMIRIVDMSVRFGMTPQRTRLRSAGGPERPQTLRILALNKKQGPSTEPFPSLEGAGL